MVGVCGISLPEMVSHFHCLDRKDLGRSFYETRGCACEPVSYTIIDDVLCHLVEGGCGIVVFGVIIFNLGVSECDREL